MSNYPSFVIKYQDYLSCRPEGIDTQNGKMWQFTVGPLEISVASFENDYDESYVILLSKDDQSEEYDAETAADVCSMFAQVMQPSEKKELDWSKEFPNMQVSEDEDELSIKIPGSDVEFLVHESNKGWNIVFINGDEMDRGGPFTSFSDVKRYVYLTLQTMRDIHAEKEYEQIESENVKLLQSAAEKVADACEEIDQVGYGKISDVLLQAMKLIKIAIEKEKSDDG